MRYRHLLLLALAALPASCASEPAPAVPHKEAGAIQIFESDVTDRKYHSLGDLSVSASKFYIWQMDPTREQVNMELQKKAAKLGADAVILVRYGTI
ncbi:MAG: hypothetical protein JWL84_2632, partial [Rhodospirillales bacterium]|nr:hypothetical protein [Rhodospirillales bacterium]